MRIRSRLTVSKKMMTIILYMSAWFCAPGAQHKNIRSALGPSIVPSGRGAALEAQHLALMIEHKDTITRGVYGDNLVRGINDA